MRRHHPPCPPFSSRRRRGRGSLLRAAPLLLALLLPVRAHGADTIEDLITETVASHDRLKHFDIAKKYGAEPVWDRTRNWVEPIGLRAGNYLILPSVGVEVAFDDNIFASNFERVSDWRTTLTPNITFKSNLARHVLDLNVQGKLVSFASHDELSHADVKAHLKSALHFDHAHTLAVSLYSGFEHEEVGSLTAPRSTGEPVPLFHNRASVGITRDVGRLYGTLAGTVERWDYQDVTAVDGTGLDQDRRDLTVFSSALKVGYRFSPGYEIVGRTKVARHVNRGDGTTDYDAMSYEGLVGLQIESSPLLSWSLLAGYGLRTFDLDTLGDVRSSLVEAHVRWLPVDRISMTATASRGFVDTLNADGSGGQLETAISARLDYEIWHDAVLNFSLRAADAKALDTSRTDRTWGAKIGLDYYFSKNWLFTLGVEHVSRDSSDDTFDLTRNIYSVGAKLRF